MSNIGGLRVGFLDYLRTRYLPETCGATLSRQFSTLTYRTYDKKHILSKPIEILVSKALRLLIEP